MKEHDVIMPDYECLHEELLQNHSLEITELRTEVGFKKEKIDELKTSIQVIDKKLDDLIIQSERDDFDIDKRVTSLENTIKVLKWVVAIGLTSIGTAVTIIGLILTLIH